jgi:hypothetical protein
MRPTRGIRRIGILFGMENSFPGALVEEINGRNVPGVRAEFVEIGAVALPREIAAAQADPHYAVVIDRISHQVPFYRSWLKAAMLDGTHVLNNPFWQSADDKFLNYALARRLGLAVPATMLLPHHLPPNGLTARSLRNLEIPFNWDRVFTQVGEHGFLKPIDGGGWRDVHEVRTQEEFFAAYAETRDLCMVYQKAIDFDAYFRCYVVGAKKVRVMAYDPHLPQAERYLDQSPRVSKALVHRMEREAALLCQALGYQMNTVEFAVAAGVPYAIDFMNPVPDADPSSVGQDNFEWFVQQMADLAIDQALQKPHIPALHAAQLLGTPPQPAKRKRRKSTKKTAARL